MYSNNYFRVILLSVFTVGCEYIFIRYINHWMYVLLACVFFIFLNIFPSFFKQPRHSLKIASDGADLLSAFPMGIIFQIVLCIFNNAVFEGNFWLSFCVFTVADLIIFWNGIIRVYLTSPIIGLKWRIIGIICGPIPIVHLFVLFKIIKLVRFDVDTERKRFARNLQRKTERVCATKYPILLIHGVFFRDIRYFNYWGRIPNELEQNGATIYYGNQQSALSVAESGREIADAIQKITDKSGYNKVNIIAHSKGGLDARYACTHLGMADKVASLTTINTPHKGCEFADWLLKKTSPKFINTIVSAYNSTLRRFGDKNPDFLAAVQDLTAENCKILNDTTPDIESIYYQSTSSKINKPLRNIFPLCFTNSFVKMFDGENDGLVSKKSAEWGEICINLKTNSPEGISHADMIDLSRHNRTDFDVCEFYVELVHALKNKGF